MGHQRSCSRVYLQTAQTILSIPIFPSRRRGKRGRHHRPRHTWHKPLVQTNGIVLNHLLLRQRNRRRHQTRRSRRPSRRIYPQRRRRLYLGPPPRIGNCAWMAPGRHSDLFFFHHRASSSPSGLLYSRINALTTVRDDHRKHYQTHQPDPCLSPQTNTIHRVLWHRRPPRNGPLAGNAATAPPGIQGQEVGSVEYQMDRCRGTGVKAGGQDCEGRVGVCVCDVSLGCDGGVRSTRNSFLPPPAGIKWEMEKMQETKS